MKTYDIRRVLVPIDFSEASLNSLDTAVTICQRQSAALTLIRVVEGHYTLFPSEPGTFYSDFLPELLNRVDRNLDALANKIRGEKGLKVNHSARLGNSSDEICKYAFDEKIDLIVMGTSVASHLQQFILGSPISRIVQNAPCPVMTIPEHKHCFDFTKILFPVRAIPNALDKYSAIRPIVKKNQSSLLIAGIANRNSRSEFSPVGQLVETIRHQMIEDDVSCENEIYYCENLAQQVLDIANLESPDLIVITATKENPPIRNFFKAAYTEEIVRHSQFSVLSIRPNFEMNQ